MVTQDRHIGNGRIKAVLLVWGQWNWSMVLFCPSHRLQEKCLGLSGGYGDSDQCRCSLIFNSHALGWYNPGGFHDYSSPLTVRTFKHGQECKRSSNTSIPSVIFGHCSARAAVTTTIASDWKGVAIICPVCPPDQIGNCKAITQLHLWDRVLANAHLSLCHGRFGSLCNSRLAFLMDGQLSTWNSYWVWFPNCIEEVVHIVFWREMEIKVNFV